jgi:rhodanese-related sulfurtransferase
LKPDELCVQQTALDGTTVWVDARPRADWMKNGVPGSVLWNLDPAEDITALEAEAMVKIASASRVIVYCGDENCGVSRQIAGRIRGLGLGVGVFVLHGGWQALRQAGLTGNGDGP